MTLMLLKLSLLANVIMPVSCCYLDEDSGEDEADIMTRNTIKRQAQQVLEQRNRRKVTKRKKTKK